MIKRKGFTWAENLTILNLITVSISWMGGGIDMGKNAAMSWLFVILGLAVIVGSAYMIISYATDILNAIVNFVITSDYQKLRQCGIDPPSQFNKLKDDLPGLILPFLYLGLPALLLLISFLMFLGGYYHGKARYEHETYREAQMERKVSEKYSKKTQPVPKKGMGEPKEEFEENEQEAEEEPEEESEEEEKPQSKAKPKKR